MKIIQIVYWMMILKIYALDVNKIIIYLNQEYVNNWQKQKQNNGIKIAYTQQKTINVRFVILVIIHFNCFLNSIK